MCARAPAKELENGPKAVDETCSALWGVEALVLPLLLFLSPLPWAPPGLPANSVNAQLGLIRTTRVASQVAAALQRFLYHFCCSGFITFSINISVS